MDLYELLKTFHVIAAVVWVGGATTIQIMAIRATSSKDPSKITSLAGDAEWIGQRVFLPSSLLLLALGIAMVVKEEAWAFGDTWIVIGLGGILSSALVGSLFLGPESGRIGRLIEAEGPETPEVQSRLRRIFVISRIELVVLLIVVADMVVKPGL
ncbi:MAG: DUF2269 domain-containing protein [Actinomycetota bacterium]|nr:DUF2269 domain-containing protein [Actinomycetota bacterium]